MVRVRVRARASARARVRVTVTVTVTVTVRGDREGGPHLGRARRRGGLPTGLRGLLFGSGRRGGLTWLGLGLG